MSSAPVLAAAVVHPHVVHAVHAAVAAAVTRPHVLHAVLAAVVLHQHAERAVATAHAAAHRVTSRVTSRVSRWLAALGLVRKPKISVITPTWKRRRLLTGRCIPSVLAQTWPQNLIEHIIVSDGPDPDLAGVPGVTYLPAHFELPNRGVLARWAGTLLATGDLIAYLDDDNAWRPRHLEVLAGAIEEQDVSFAYSQALCRNGGGHVWVVGCARPVFAQIDTSLIMHKAGLLETATWRPSGQPADWDLVERWLQVGARWAHVPEITLDYYARSAEGVPC